MFDLGNFTFRFWTPKKLRYLELEKSNFTSSNNIFDFTVQVYSVHVYDLVNTMVNLTTVPLGQGFISLSSELIHQPSRFLIYKSSMLLRTHLATSFLNPSLSSRYCLAASIFAGLSSFGSANIEITDMRIDSTV